MARYCTVDDLRQVAAKYRNQIQGSGKTPTPITTAQAEQLIDDASDQVRAIMQPAYKISIIDGYDPDFPPLIVMLTKLLAGLYLYNRYGAANNSEDIKIRQSLERTITQVRRSIAGRNLVDTLGAKVPTQDPGFALITGTSIADEDRQNRTFQVEYGPCQ